MARILGWCIHLHNKELFVDPWSCQPQFFDGIGFRRLLFCISGLGLIASVV
jgi:hypothetical protein